MLIDRLGTRRGFLVIMVFWSLACASHSLATSVWMLAASRFLLGAGEGGGFPAATKVIAEWFPVARALDRDGHRQCRDGGRRRRGAAGDRGDPALWQLAVGVRRLRRRRSAVGGVVVIAFTASVTFAHASADRRRTACDMAPARCLVEPARATPGLGARRREVPHRRGVVLLHRLAAEVSLRRARIRREAGRLLRVGAVRGSRRSAA